MITTIDKAGRVIIPTEVRKRLGLNAGTELEMVIDGFAIHLVRAVAGPQFVRRGAGLVACPQAAEGERTEVDVVHLIEQERQKRKGRTLAEAFEELRSICEEEDYSLEIPAQ